MRFRKPSFKKSLAARLSWKRAIRHRLGLKARRGLGVVTNPRRALYNRIYHRTTKGCGSRLMILLAVTIIAMAMKIQR